MYITFTHQDADHAYRRWLKQSYLCLILVPIVTSTMQGVLEFSLFLHETSIMYFNSWRGMIDIQYSGNPFERSSWSEVIPLERPLINVNLNRNVLISTTDERLPLLKGHISDTKEMGGSRCGRADSVLDSHTTGPGFKTWLVRYFLLSFRLLTTMTASSWAFAGVCGRSGKDFTVGSHPRH